MPEKNNIPEYNFKKQEKKWQEIWEAEKLYQPDLDKSQKPFYNLMMFPYPSAEGLHIGGVYTFTGVDTYGRFKKMQGYDVFEPIGLDGFGIHSENYAMKIGEHIKQVSERTEKNFYRQLSSIGNMYDWSRTVETYKPEYYKWTQWLFLELFKKDLAYQKKAKVNWCPWCKTVLSDEQVIQGLCERCDSQVEKKELNQWFFKITEYADRLLKNLEWIDWSEDVKTNQKNWIGKSEGAKINFLVKSQKSKVKSELRVFTTRPDTLFGATYMVLAPEHGLISEMKGQIKNWEEVEKYVTQAKNKSEQERKEEEKEKTGVEVKGIRAVNPVNNEEIPIWIADYVLAGYGTGAIMAVPAHDERDWDFAKKYGIKIKEVVAKKTGTKTGDEIEKRGGCAIVFDSEKQKYAVIKRTDGFYAFYSGGAEEKETLFDGVMRELKEESGFHNYGLVEQLAHAYVYYYNSIKNHRVCGLALCNLVVLKDRDRLPLQLEEHEKEYETIWVTPDELLENWENLRDCNDGSLDHWRWFLNQGVARLQKLRIDKQKYKHQFKKEVLIEKGIAVNSGFLDGLKTDEAKSKMIKWLEEKGIGKKSVDYKLRDWCVSRQRYWGPPIPIVWCKECAKKKAKVLIIHGFEDSGEGNWIPGLKKKLEAEGVEVFNPTMPESKHPKQKEWIKALKPYLEKLDENSIIIGHSLGSKAAIDLLSESDKQIGQLFLVASAIGSPRKNWDEFKKIWKGADVDSLKAFWETEINWASVNKSVLGNTHVIISEDDPYIDPEHYKLAQVDDLVIQKWDGFKHFTGKEFEKLEKYIVDEFKQGLKPEAVAVPEKELPVKLPDMEDFLPEGKGKGPLAKNKEFVKTKCPNCGADAERETDVSDPFVDSAWYFLRYPSTEFENEAINKERAKNWLPVDSYIGGKEHTVLHLLYSRFIAMVLSDLGYIEFEEPYKRFFGHGLITKDGAKMSKSKGNVINPDEMLEKYGADTVRLYLRFLGDFSQGGDWRDDGAEGMSRFVKKTWNLFFDLKGVGQGVEKTHMIDRTIKVIGEDIDKLSFNTAVARYMEFVNWIKDNSNNFDQKQTQKIKETMALVLAPMAPFMAEEFWLSLGNDKSIFIEKWPEYNEDNLEDDSFELVVQINGKVRDKIVVSRGISEEEANKKALNSEKISKNLDGKKPKKIIYIRGKLINIVV